MSLSFLAQNLSDEFRSCGEFYQMAAIHSDLVREGFAGSDPLLAGMVADAAASAAADMAFVIDSAKLNSNAASTNAASSGDRFFASLSRWRVIIFAQALDVAVIIALSLLAYQMTGHKSYAMRLHDLIFAGIVAGLAHFSFFQGRLYEIDLLMDPERSIRSLFLRWSVIFTMLAALAALAHQPDVLSRLWFAGFYVGGIAALAVERWFVAWLIRAWIARGHHTLCVAVVGVNELAEKLISRFAQNRWGIHFVGVFDDRRRENVRDVAGVRKLGTITDLLEFSKTHELDLVVVTLPITASDRIQAVIKQLRQQPVNVRVLPGAIGLERISPIRLDRTELPGVQLIAIADRPISEFALLAKTAFDRTAAALVLIAISPVLLACAAGIAMTSPGPILFRQKRIGYKGREFDIMKFRTMHVAERPNTELTQRDDPRIFSFGSFLRKTSLDELPQLINVLKGNMSLVGPRPHMPEARAAGKLYLDAVLEYADRQRVKPGITGWAQVNGWRGPTETIEQIERRVEYDIYYIENWSLMLDFIIIVKTALVGFYGKNAY